MRGLIAFVLALCLLTVPGQAQQPQAQPQDPLDYRSLAALTLRRNLDLQTARATVELAEARLQQAQAERNPTLVFNGLYENKSPGSLGGQLPDPSFIPVAEAAGARAKELYLAGQNSIFNRAILNIPIYSGGRLEAAIQAADFRHLESQADYQALCQKLLYHTKRAYLDVLLAQERIEVAELNLARAKETLRYARSRLDAGTGNAYEWHQAGVAVSLARTSLTQSQSDLESAQIGLSAMLHGPLPFAWKVSERLRDARLLAAESVPAESRRQLVGLALARRPELQAWRCRLHANQQDLVRASSGQLPQVYANLNYDLLGNPAELRSGFQTLLAMQLPLSDGGVSAAQVEGVDCRKMQLTLQELKEAQRIALEVVQAVADVREADSRLQVAQAACQAAAEATDVSLKRFRVGAGTSLELVTAQSLEAEARYALSEAHYRQLLARATLSYAVAQP